MKKLYFALMQRFAKRTLARQPEMDILMLDRSQNAEYTRDGEDGSLATVYELIVNAILRLSPLEGKALDICCGSASLLCKIAKAMPQMQFLGVDLSANMLEFAAEQKSKYGLKNLRFQRADMYNLDKELEAPFDLITWHLAMHHCTDEAAVIRVLKQIPKLLKPGGTLFVFDINRPKTGDLALLMADIFNCRQGDWFYQDSLDSYKAGFSFEEVEEILKKAELKNVKHVEPMISNIFHAFYISQTDNVDVPRVAQLKHLWQKVDYVLLRTFFPSLPLARGPVAVSAQEEIFFNAALQEKDLGRFNQDIVAILEIGTRAMNTYNLQPWRFRIDGNTVFVHFIRLKNFFLKLEGVYYMIVGHLLANIIAGAKAKGYSVEYEILSEALSIDEPCMKLHFTAGGEKNLQDLTPLLNRVTNRFAYSTRKLESALKDTLLALNNDQNIEIRFLEDEGMREFAALLSELELVRLNNSRLALEALEFIRFDKKEVDSQRDHLDVNSLGVKPFESTMMRLLRKSSWLYAQAKIFGSIARIYLRHRNLMTQSGTIMTFILKNRSYRDYIQLGIVVQSIANTLTAHGVSSMPVLSGIYLADVLQENPEILSNKDKNSIIHCLRKMAQFLKIHEQRVSYVLRAGYSDRVPPQTLRKRIHEVIYK
jgi:ubiquinone/menaquinone biosynthesis C-methylase UbiE